GAWSPAAASMRSLRSIGRSTRRPRARRQREAAVTQNPVLAEALRPGFPREAHPRSPAKTISILLPVWGDEFVGQFLDDSLPTLLAPGNIPALAAALPTRFVFLTRARDEAAIRAHPAGRHLAQVSEVAFSPIDDLIAPGNHS